MHAFAKSAKRMTVPNLIQTQIQTKPEYQTRSLPSFPSFTNSFSFGFSCLFKKKKKCVCYIFVPLISPIKLCSVLLYYLHSHLRLMNRIRQDTCTEYVIWLFVIPMCFLLHHKKYSTILFFVHRRGIQTFFFFYGLPSLLYRLLKYIM